MKICTTADRLQQLLRERNLKQVQILEACEPHLKKHNVKMNKSDLSQYVSGKVEPGQEKLTVLSQALGVSEVWLMGYDVTESGVQLSAPAPSDNSRVLLLARNMQDLDADDQHVLDLMIKRMREKGRQALEE